MNAKLQEHVGTFFVKWCARLKPYDRREFLKNIVALVTAVNENAVEELTRQIAAMKEKA